MRVCYVTARKTASKSNCEGELVKTNMLKAFGNINLFQLKLMTVLTL